jgi:hypothetical protein
MLATYRRGLIVVASLFLDRFATVGELQQP